MRPIALPLTLLAALAISLPAFADQIDDFTLTGAGTTIMWSLPAHYISPFPDHPHNISFIQGATGTVNGVDGYQLFITFYTPNSPFSGLDISTLSGNLIPHLSGNSGASNPIDTIFEIGTFTLIDYGSQGIPVEDRYWTYTIAPQVDVSSVPEPAPLALFGTGMIGLVSAIRYRTRVRQVHLKPGKI
jgi:hypothetical protein